MRILPPTKIYVSHSPIHGLGVFASEIIKEGEIIEECPYIDLKIKKGESSSVLGDYRFNWPQGDEWELQVCTLGWGSLYNHSDNPNAAWRSNFINNTFEFFATRDIQPQEEVLVWYGGVEYWNDGRTHTNVI